ncbi:MAG: dienelactone hydrolase family protein [Acidimicrobiales bacterium]
MTRPGYVTHIVTERGSMPVHLSVPEGDGRYPGVVLVHDTLGPSNDLYRQADWLASEGFVAAAPDLYYWDSRLRCSSGTGSNTTSWSTPMPVTAS